MFISIVTIKFTTAGSIVVCDIYYNYIFTVQVLQEFLMMRCTQKFVSFWKDAFVGRAHRYIRQDCSKILHQASGISTCLQTCHDYNSVMKEIP